MFYICAVAISFKTAILHESFALIDTEREGSGNRRNEALWEVYCQSVLQFQLFSAVNAIWIWWASTLCYGVQLTRRWWTQTHNVEKNKNARNNELNSVRHRSASECGECICLLLPCTTFYVFHARRQWFVCHSRRIPQHSVSPAAKRLPSSYSIKVSVYFTTALDYIKFD